MKKILSLCLLSISFSQEFDYSKMSDAEKIMMYSEMKKSPVAAYFLECLVPTAGYAYADEWKRGLKVKGLSLLTMLAGAGITELKPGYKYDSNGNNITGDRNFMYHVWEPLGLGVFSIGVIGYLYSYYDAINQTSKYNKRLKRQIFGKKKNKMKASLYPLQDGAGISLTYLIN